MNADIIMIIAVDHIRSTYDDPTPVASMPVNGRVVVTADNGKYGVTVNSDGDVVKVEQIPINNGDFRHPEDLARNEDFTSFTV